MKRGVGYLYINGLGSGNTTFKDKVVRWWWQQTGLDIRHAHINWFDDESLDEKLAAVERQVQSMLREFHGVVIIGSSAGGSLAVNTFYRLRRKNVCAVNAHGRLKVGAYPTDNRMSLYRRAHLASDRPSQSFYDSVVMCETYVLPKLSAKDKARLLVLTQWRDMIVPLETMTITGVEQHRSRTYGHSGGFVAHLLGCRDLIVDFAEKALT